MASLRSDLAKKIVAILRGTLHRCRTMDFRKLDAFQRQEGYISTIFIKGKNRYGFHMYKV